MQTLNLATRETVPPLLSILDLSTEHVKKTKPMKSLDCQFSNCPKPVNVVVVQCIM